MAISQLSLTDFRNLTSTTLDFHPRLNLITGKNGSGKTSLLEAIYVVCQACSFRTHQLKQCIRHDKASLLLFGRSNSHKAGLSKSDKKLEIHLDGKPIKRRSELVRKAPVQVLNADSFSLISGSPQLRRQFIDWCLFHVEHSYADDWLLFKHALKQRNRLLKTRQDMRQLPYWDQHLLEPALRLSQLRRLYCDQLDSLLDQQSIGILEGISVSLEYQQGWPQPDGLEQSLEKSRTRDIKSGFTNCGIHRDDLKILSRGRPVLETLSRGQSKRLCLALILSALKLVNKQAPGQIILLIDDLHSELDSSAQKMVYDQLGDMDLQLFISNIDEAIPEAVAAKEFKMFHVEHGMIKPRKFS